MLFTKIIKNINVPHNAANARGLTIQRWCSWWVGEGWASSTAEDHGGAPALPPPWLWFPSHDCICLKREKNSQPLMSGDLET